VRVPTRAGDCASWWWQWGGQAPPRGCGGLLASCWSGSMCRDAYLALCADTLCRHSTGCHSDSMCTVTAVTFRCSAPHAVAASVCQRPTSGSCSSAGTGGDSPAQSRLNSSLSHLTGKCFWTSTSSCRSTMRALHAACAAAADHGREGGRGLKAVLVCVCVCVCLRLSGRAGPRSPCAPQPIG